MQMAFSLGYTPHPLLDETNNNHNATSSYIQFWILVSIPPVLPPLRLE